MPTNIHEAFVAPIPLTARPHHAAPLKTCPRSSLSPIPSMTLPSPPHQPHTNDKNPVWNGVRRLVRVSAVSASVLFSAALPVPRQSIRNHFHSFTTQPAAAATASTQSTASKSASNTSDVEAAAMTLGAVTIGGLVMRAIVKSRHDEDEEKSRVAMECQRLQDEEKERALRVKRKKMESVDGVAVDDDLLMSDFMNRVKSLESDSPQDADDPTDPTHMRHNPIPDRGLGSALLDRPDVDADAADSDDGLDIIEEEQQQLPEPDLANAEQAEMLKRMWNLSSPDKE